MTLEQVNHKECNLNPPALASQLYLSRFLSRVDGPKYPEVTKCFLLKTKRLTKITEEDKESWVKNSIVDKVWSTQKSIIKTQN